MKSMRSAVFGSTTGMQVTMRFSGRCLMRRMLATEKEFLDAIQKVIKSYAKFNSTPLYMTYN